MESLTFQMFNQLLLAHYDQQSWISGAVKDFLAFQYINVQEETYPTS